MMILTDSDIVSKKITFQGEFLRIINIMRRLESKSVFMIFSQTNGRL